MALSKLILAVLLLGAPASELTHSTAHYAQDDAAEDGFYSGNVVTVAAGKVSVTRSILNKKPETRTFVINENTKVEGKLKPKSRVTVRFVPGDDGDVAVSILVRPDAPSPKKK